MSTVERCADLSERAGESLGATATTAENWLLIEVAGTWPRDVSEGEGLSRSARRAVCGWLEQSPSSRLMFIRRPGRARARSLAFVVHAGEASTHVRRIELASHEEVADLDLSSAGTATDARLVLVCGHGSRDACCALRGTAVYGSLTETLDDDELWISSHQGGHRFAANVLVLPHGIHLGRLTPASAARLVERALAGRIALSHYRGRASYPALAQAAERAIRERFGLDALGDLRLAEIDGDRVVFRRRDGSELAAAVEAGIGPSVPASCGAAAEPQATLTARVV